MKKLKLNHLKGSYEIIIEKNLFKNIDGYLKKYSGSKKFILTDENVYKIYKKELLNISKFIITVPAGEKSKSLKVYSEVIEKLLEEKFSRSDILITIGGGVVGDLGGFVASTILRGVKYIQVPTTLLSQIDSSIGGKVAVNSKYGKNLIGQFYHPSLVIIDPIFLKTLELRELKSGFGELLKYSLIKDKSLFNDIKKYNCYDKLLENIEEIIYKSLLIKKEVVELDEFDKGQRMILNFGHTIGHGIEKYYSKDEISHGEAVALGIRYIVEIFEKLELTKKGSLSEILEVYKSYGMKKSIDFPLKELIPKINQDKKIFDGIINIIILEEIGSVRIKKYSLDEFENIL